MTNRMLRALGALLFTAAVSAVPAARAEEPPAPAPEKVIVTPELEQLMKEVSKGKSSFDERMARAIYTLGYLGPNAAPAVPTLLEALRKHPGLTQQILRALGMIGPAAMKAKPALIEMLENDRYRKFALAALCQIDPEAARAAFPKFVGLYREGQWRDLLGDRCLQALGPAAKELVPVIAPQAKPAYGGPGNRIGDEATLALACIGEAAVPSLIGQLQNKGARETALALGRIGPDAKAAVPVLKAAVLSSSYSDDAGVRAAAVEALFLIAGADKDNVAFLESCVLNVRHHEAAETAAQCLMKLDCAEESSKRLCPRLVPALGASYPAHSQEPYTIMRLLGILRADQPGLNRTMVGLLSHQNAAVRRYAAEALGGIRPVTEDTVRALAKALKDPDVGGGTVRDWAARSLAALGKDTAPIKEELKAVLDERFGPTRVRIAEAYWNASGDAETAVGTILDAARRDHGAEIPAAGALARMAPETPCAVRALAEMLVDDLAGREARRALMAMGAGAKEAIPVLEKGGSGRKGEGYSYGILMIKDAVHREELGGGTVPAKPRPVGTPEEPAIDDEF